MDTLAPPLRVISKVFANYSSHQNLSPITELLVFMK